VSFPLFRLLSVVFILFLILRFAVLLRLQDIDRDGTTGPLQSGTCI
jgi:hypothetical protein